MMINDLEKRIIFLDKELKTKKKIIEKDMAEFEKICNELISLKTKLEEIEAQKE